MIKKYLLTGLTLATLVFTNPVYANESDEDNLKCVDDYITNTSMSREERSQKKAEIYEKAAEKRRKAAEIQAQHGADLSNQADSYKLNSPEKETDKERLQRYLKAGDLELKASDMQIAAAINYANSAANYGNAINAHKKISKDKLEKLKKDLKDDTRDASTYYTRATKTCLKAAQTYNEAENQEKSGKAIEKAAIILEYIISEKP